VPDDDAERWRARLGAGILVALFLGEVVLLCGMIASAGVLSVPTALVVSEVTVAAASLFLLRLTGRFRAVIAGTLVGTSIYLSCITFWVGVEEGALAFSLLGVVLTATFVLGRRWTFPTVVIAGTLQVAAVLPHLRDEPSALPSVVGLMLSLGIVSVLLYIIEGSRSRAVDEARERAQAEEAARAANQLAEAQGRFLATMSHEIRTPMNGVLNMNRMLAETELDAEQSLLVHTALSSGQTLLAVLNDILDFSRIEAGEVMVESVRFDLPELLESVVRLLRAPADNRGVDVRVDIDDAVPRHVRGDPTRVRQIVTNLVSNALKFTEQGHVWVRAAPAGADTIAIAVEDSGIGIAADVLPSLFNAFTQADASTTRRFGGTGLGLSISKRLAQLMGGDIDVQSKLGAGSTFTVRLPLPAASAPARDLALVRPDFTDLRVLVAEDNDVNRMVIERMLARLGAQVTVVPDGVRALEHVVSEVVDVVLMDLHMPELDGIGATLAIRALDGEAGSVPIVALTASVLAADRDRCLAAGMDDHLAKPIQPEALQRVLSRWSRKAA